MSKLKIRPEIVAFAAAMESKMRKHDADRGDSWKKCNIDFLHQRIEEEMSEMSLADGDEISDEAVDVGNFAMMIWYRNFRMGG